MFGTEEKGRSESRRARPSPRGSVRVGTLVLAAAVALLMALAPSAAGALGNSAKILKAPFKGTPSSPYYAAFASGCASATTVEASWAGVTGQIHGLDSTSSKICKPVIGGGNTGGTASSTTSISVGIPFQVGSNGSHSVGSQWTVTPASVQTYTLGGCPASHVTPHPPLGRSASALCQTSAGHTFSLSVSLIDLNNGSWYSFNSSSAASSNTSGWENYTYCSNFGAPSCSNYTGATGSTYLAGSNDPGFAAFAFTGKTTFTLWNNATGMVAGHHYLMLVNLVISATSYAFMYNLKVPWVASASAGIDMATLGHGARLVSLTIG